MIDLLERLITKYGDDNQLNKAIEELSELIRALSRKDIENIIEEIVDVEIMLHQVRIILKRKIPNYQEIYSNNFQKKIKKLHNLLRS